MTILPHPTTKFGTCQVPACQNFAITPVVICSEMLCELTTVGGKVRNLPPIFWAAAIFCHPE
jgi:hypothetical protein